MSGDEEGFLNRWSRRKQDAAKEAEESVAPAEQAAPLPQPGELPAEEEAFDISTLPPVESITAATDIRAFFAKGVPAALTQAALRRAWTADPAIRDYVGLSEYSWDFNAPGQFGFGEIDPSINIQEMVADVFGKVKEAVSKTDTIAETGKPELSPEEIGAIDSEPPNSVELRRDKPQVDSQTDLSATHAEIESGDITAQAHTAPQQLEDDADALRVPVRRHGGALPT